MKQYHYDMLAHLTVSDNEHEHRFRTKNNIFCQNIFLQKKIGLSQVHNTTKKTYTLNQFNNLERTLIRDDMSALKLK